MLESHFQHHIICRLKEEFPDCIVLKNDSSYIQGIPDLLVLCDDTWVALEIKNNISANKQPNQEYWIRKMNDMSFAAFLYPENEEEIFNEIHKTFRT